MQKELNPKDFTLIDVKKKLHSVRYDRSGSPISRTLLGSSEHYQEKKLVKDTQKKVGAQLLGVMMQRQKEILHAKTYGIKRVAKNKQFHLNAFKLGDNSIKNMIAMPTVT